MTEFRMPEVRVGDTVYWKQHPGSDVTAAVVTAVGQNTISVSVLVPGYSNLYVADGVPHEEDPRATRIHDIEVGCWAHMEGPAAPPEAAPSPKRGRPKAAEADF